MSHTPERHSSSATCDGANSPNAPSTNLQHGIAHPGIAGRALPSIVMS